MIDLDTCIIYTTMCLSRCDCRLLFTLLHCICSGLTVDFYFHCSGCSGLVAATFGTPADVVKTRIMNQPTKNGK